jgi:hypothetical protein
MIAVCRLRYCSRTRAYAQRRIAEGKTKKEIIRCLKRYIARETYHALSADLADLIQPPAATTTAVTINCGAGPIGRTRRGESPSDSLSPSWGCWRLPPGLPASIRRLFK